MDVGDMEGASLRLGDRSAGAENEGGKPTGSGIGAKVIVATGTAIGMVGAGTEGMGACGGAVIGGDVSNASVSDETSTTSVVFRLPTMEFC